MAKQLTEKQVQIAQRQKARHYAVQALYQRELSKSDLNKIEAEFIADNDFTKVDTAYFHELLHKIPAELDELDAAIEPALSDRTMTDIGPVEISLLRMGSYELKNRIDIPYKVVINEAVQLSKKFGPVESHKFVNAILDKVAEQFRQIELKAAGR